MFVTNVFGLHAWLHAQQERFSGMRQPEPFSSGPLIASDAQNAWLRALLVWHPCTLRPVSRLFAICVLVNLPVCSDAQQAQLCMQTLPLDAGKGERIWR